MATQLSPEEVQKIASLAAMHLSEVEVKKFQGWLTEALNYIEVLQEIDTSKTPETSQVTGLINIWRADQARVSLTQKQALQNAPRQLRGYFKVDPALER